MKRLSFLLVLCFVFASIPFGVVASEYVEYPYVEGQISLMTNYFVDPDEFANGGSYEFNGVTITEINPQFPCETEDDVNNWIAKFEDEVLFPYTIKLTSDWEVMDAVAVLEQSENIRSATPVYISNPKREPSTEPQYLTENLVDFQVTINDSRLTSEAREEYKDREYLTSYGFDMPVEVMQSKDDLDDYLTKYENYAEIHEFASSLPEDYFDTYALFVIYATGGTSGVKYYVLGVASTEQKTIIEYEYSYDKYGLSMNYDNAIIIQVKKNDIKNFNNVITYSTDLVSESINYTLPGDVFRNGLHDAKDYVLIKRFCVGAGTLSEKQIALADVNGDGDVDKKDYSLVKRACFAQ